MSATKRALDGWTRTLMGGLFALGAGAAIMAIGGQHGLIVAFAVLWGLLHWALSDFEAIARGLGATLSSLRLRLLVHGVYLIVGAPLMWSAISPKTGVLQLALYSIWVAHIAITLRRSTAPLCDLLAPLLAAIYLVLPLMSLLCLLRACGADAALRQSWAIYAVAVTKVSDIGAWYVGSRWGRRSLGSISPYKTQEGFIGGIAAGFIAGSALVAILPQSAQMASTWALCALHLAIGVIAQLGDLLESLLKRSARLRHSGRLPGLGGILDLIDSLLLTSPLLYLVNGL